MQIQTNNFQGIYGKMARSQLQKRPQTQSEGFSENSNKNPCQSVKTRNAFSPYDVYASLRGAGAKCTAGKLNAQAKQPVEKVENERYLIEKSDEIKGFWRVYDKRFDKTFLCDPNHTTVQTDGNTGKNYLVANAPIGGLMDVMPADGTLMETLAQFLKVEGADSISTSSLNENYTITVDPFTGIECLKIKGNEGNGSWTMISDERQLEKLQELADIYRKSYPNLIKSDGVAMGFAQAETAGQAVRTPNGILTIACNGLGYRDNDEPAKDWDVQYSIHATHMYTEIMRAMTEGYIVGKDIEDFSKWEEYFEDRELEFERVLSDEELGKL